MDPLTGSYPWYTPYQFAGKKPIRFIDLDGKEELDVFKKWGVNSGYTGGFIAGIGDSYINTAIYAGKLWLATKRIQAYSLVGPGAPVAAYKAGEFDAAIDFSKLVHTLATDEKALANVEAAFKQALGNYVDEFTGKKGAGIQGYQHGKATFTIAETLFGPGGIAYAASTGRFAGKVAQGLRESKLISTVIDITKRGAAAGMKGKSGVYVHKFKGGKVMVEKVYVGQATDLSVRPRKSYRVVN